MPTNMVWKPSIVAMCTWRTAAGESAVMKAARMAAASPCALRRQGRPVRASPRRQRRTAHSR